MQTTTPRPKKKAVNVSIDAAIAAEAKAAGIKLSGVLEAALNAELKAGREAAWKAEHREAIEKSNQYFEKHGLPLDKYRVW